MSARLLPVRALVHRALVVYALLRMSLALFAVLLSVSGGRSAEPGVFTAIGMIALAMTLGAIDIRRRRESVLWANLGYPPIVAPLIYGAVALSGEVIIAWLFT
jgi:hypothetical protein